ARLRRMNGYGSQRRPIATALTAIQAITTSVWPAMYFGVPKKRAAASARRPKASSPKALGTRGTTKGSRPPKPLLPHCHARGPGCAGPSGGAQSRFELCDREYTVAVSDHLAAGDLRRVGHRRVELLVGDPLRDDHRRLVGLLGGLEETERAEDAAAAAFDQVVAGKAGELAQLRDERVVDLFDDVVDAGDVDAFVAPNGGMHVMLLLFSCRAARSNGRTAAVRPGVTVGEERAKSLGGFNS